MKTRTWMVFMILLSLAASTGTLGPPTVGVQAADPVQMTRQGAWLDSIVLTEDWPPASAISRLQAGELDLYAYSRADLSLLQTVLEDPDLAYTESYGSYNELTFNPYGPTFNDGRLNPFSSPAIREAMNRLIDRGYIAQAICGGLATPRWVPVHTTGADRARYQGTIEDLEAEYAYDLAGAQAAIANEMEALDAYLDDGTWHHDGEEVNIILLIRTEDERREIGDYVADQLQKVGFAVTRDYKSSAEASPIWIGGDPAEGLFHVYTGGWITTAVPRDEGGNFDFFYTPRGLSVPLWEAYHPSAEFDEVARQLGARDFESLAERRALFEQALDLALEDSARVWLVDRISFTPRRAETAVVSDRAGGVVGAEMWPYVARFEGIEGGTMRTAVPSLLNEPWNPIAGTSWLYDMMPIHATQDYAFITDPHTGLARPQRAERTEVVVVEGLPVTRTLEWVDLSFTPTISVPPDAWVDWDAEAQEFVTAADEYPDGLTATVKSTVYYSAELFTTVTWHDGSPLDLSDFVMSMILTFDRGNPDSPIYDERAVSGLDSFLSHFRGVRIVSEQPLVIETYDDAIQLDAELLTWPWWPNYGYGPGGWHNLAAGVRAEAAGELAFSRAKADQLGVGWMSYVAGPSLDILEGWMDQSADDGYIPYEPTLGAYVTPAEAGDRWAALQSWYAERGHFWLGTGPFYLASASQANGTAELLHNEDFPDDAGRWDAFVAPPNPEMQINYQSGAPGSYFNVSGTGFPPNDTAAILANNHLLDELSVDGSGAISFTLTTEEASAGTYHLRTTVNPSGGARFVLNLAEPVRPREGDLPLVEVPDGLILHYVYLPLALRNH